MAHGIRKIAPEENCLPVRVGVGSRLGLVLGLGATRQLPWRNIDPRLGLEVGLGLVLGLGGNFPRG